MSDQNGTVDPKAEPKVEASETESVPAVDKAKGKGKAAETPDVMEETEESSAEESGPEEQNDEAEMDDDMGEIDPSNIVEGGRRTRGKQIDFAKAAEAAGDEEDDEEDDEDFEVPDDAMEE